MNQLKATHSADLNQQLDAKYCVTILPELQNIERWNSEYYCCMQGKWAYEGMHLSILQQFLIVFTAMRKTFANISDALLS